MIKKRIFNKLTKAKTEWEQHLIKLSFRDKYKLSCAIERVGSLRSDLEVEEVSLSYFEDADFINYINENYKTLHLDWNYHDNSFIFTSSERSYVFIYTGVEGRKEKIIYSGFKKFQLSKFEKYYNEQEEVD